MSNSLDKSFVLINKDEINDDLFNSAIFVDKPKYNMTQNVADLIQRNMHHLYYNMPTIYGTKRYVAETFANKLVDTYADQAINSSIDFLLPFSTKTAVKIFLVNKVVPFGFKSAAGKFSDKLIDKIIENTGDPFGEAIKQFISNEAIKHKLKGAIAHEILGEGHFANLHDFMIAPVPHIPTILDDASPRAEGKIKDLNAIKVAYGKALMWKAVIEALQAELVGELGGVLVNNAPSLAKNSAIGRMVVAVLPTIISDNLGAYLKTMGGQYTDIDIQICNAEIMLERNNIIQPSYSENISEVKSTGYGFAWLDKDYGKLTHIREAGVTLNKCLFNLHLEIVHIYENMLDNYDTQYTLDCINNAIAQIESLENDMETARTKYRTDIQPYMVVENPERRNGLLKEIKYANDQTHNNAKLEAIDIKSKIKNLLTFNLSVSNSMTLPEKQKQVDNAHGYLGWMMGGMQSVASQAYNTAEKVGGVISNLTHEFKIPNIFWN
jgi:hypothetical protein